MEVEVPGLIATSRRSKHIGLELMRKIRDRSANLGIIGLEYAGIHLALEMAEKGFRVTGIDIDGSKVEAVNAGISFVADVPNDTLYSAVLAGSIRATQSFASVEFLDAISILIPLRETKEPDLSYLMAAVEAVHNHLKPGKLIIIESTIGPGNTREIVLPILERSGLKAGRDFFLAYSPARAYPSDTGYMARDIPKVIGGVTPRCTTLAAVLYHQFFERIIPVSSSESAEMVEFLENSFRSVNVALANEMARICARFGVNVSEVIKAAKSKPFDFMPGYPSPGSSKHSLTFEPNYLNEKAGSNGLQLVLGEVGAIVNSQMPAFTISRIADALKSRNGSVTGSNILVVGIAHTRDRSGLRESPAMDIVRSLHEKGAVVSYSDPQVLSIEVEGRTLTSTTITAEILSAVDCVVILTDHPAFDYQTIVTHSRLVLDCRNGLRKYHADNVIPL